MRALFKFPALSERVFSEDTICPCLQVRNTYDGSARIALHIGAFRFVCTNLAVGGGGVFAGGFVSIHAGEIPIEEMGEHLQSYLSRFENIVSMYRAWREQTISSGEWDSVLSASLNRRFSDLRTEMQRTIPPSVFDAYNQLTDHATHKMRSARTAFDMLERVNTSFQHLFPVNRPRCQEREEVESFVGA